MNDPNAELDLFELGQNYFDAFARDFAAYGIQADPNLELRRGAGMLCYYDLKDGHIYLSLPDIQAPEGKLHLLFMRSLLSCQDNDELLSLFKLLLPHVIAHEMAHHFRQKYGLFADDLWHEEQIANQLAIAVTRHHLSPEQREQAASLLKRAMDGLADKLGINGEAADSYHSIWEAFAIDGQLDSDDLGMMDLAQQFFGTDPIEMLKSSGQLSEDISHRLGLREDLIDEINKQYASDQMRYMYYQLGWILLNLTSPKRQYVDEFARQHLNLTIPMLLPVSESPPPGTPANGKRVGFNPLAFVQRHILQLINPEEADQAPPGEVAILACFKSHEDTLPHSEAGGRYFYKRYRSLLLARMQAVAPVEQFQKEPTFIFQAWDGQIGKTDMLAFLSHLAPPALQELFPHQIVEHPDLERISPDTQLPTETDSRLWKHICLKEEDAEASNTLARLTLLEQIEIFRTLPAETMLEMCRNLFLIRLDTGEPIIWQGEQNDDVYILVNGKLDVFSTDEEGEKAVGAVNAGEVCGEMSFFTHEKRKASVRAAEKSECLVLKDADLHILAYKYPAIFLQIARILTKRMSRMLESS